MSSNSPTLRILVVDDNRDAADSLSRLIQLWGHVVRTAYDETAVDLVTTFHPDIVLLDLGMPRMDGASMAQHMRQKSTNNRLVLVAVTGFHDDQTRQRCQKVGIDQFMVKPVDLAALERLLKATGNEKQRLASQPSAEAES